MPDNWGPITTSLELDAGPLQDGLNKSERSFKRFTGDWTKKVDRMDRDWKRFTKDTGKVASRGLSPTRGGALPKPGGGSSGGGNGFFKKALGRERTALGDLGVSSSGILGLIGGGAAIGLIGKSISSFLEYDKVVRSLDTSLNHLPGQLSAASSAINDLNGYLDMTREELAAVASGIAQLHLEEFGKNTKKNSRAFRELMKDTIHLAKSLDTSTSSVVDLWRSFTKVYGLPHKNLKNIASAMKYVQEKTGIAGEELVQFGKQLDDVLSRMTGLSGEAKAKVTADLMAMAGQLKKIGIEPEKVAGVFGAALKIDSAEGANWLAYITENTQYSLDQMREMIKKGDVQTPMTLWLERLKKESPEALEYQEERFKEMTGMTIGEISRLRNLSSKEMSALFKGTRAAYKDGKLHAKRAADLQNPLVTKWIALKNMFGKLWRTIGAAFLGVVTKLSQYAMPFLESLVGKLQKWVDWIASGTGGKVINEWFAGMKKAASDAWTWIVDKAKLVSDAVKEVITWWKSLSDTEKDLVKWGAVAVGVFVKLGPVIAALGGPITAVLAGLAGIYLAAKKAANWIDEEQTRGIKAAAVAKHTQNEMESVVKNKGAMRVGALKGLMSGDSPIFNKEGEVMESELARRAIEATAGLPASIRKKQATNLYENWKAAAEAMQRMPEFKQAIESRQRDLAKVAAEQGTAPGALAGVPPPIPTPPIATPTATAPASAPAPARVQAVAVSTPKIEGLLEGILDALQKISRKATRGAHPGRTPLEASVGD